MKNKFGALIVVVGVMGVFALFAGYFNLTGFTVSKQSQEFSEILDLEFEKSIGYVWQPQNQGKLSYLRISGMVEGNGEAKVYLENLLIYDSVKSYEPLENEVGNENDEETTSFSRITGNAVDEPLESAAENSTETSEESNESSETPEIDSEAEETNESTEEISEEVVEEEVIESEETNETGTEEGVEETEEILEEEAVEELEETNLENATESEGTTERKITNFNHVCDETCELEEFDLNKESYNLRIEFSGEETKLIIKEITYTLISISQTPETDSEIEETNETEEIEEEIIEEEFVELEETNETEEIEFIVPENLNCETFKETLLWSSGYSNSQGSLNYTSWWPNKTCENCFIANVEIETRFLSFEDANRNAEGYVQISNPEQSICNNPETGTYEKYLAYETLRGESQKKGQYCGNNKNQNSTCGIEFNTDYSLECYGIKSYADPKMILDTFKIKYSICGGHHE
ncbi:MAG: hypothetical protein WDZ77_01395 [Candidatus Pacearchaeota archaeon]